MRHKHISNKTVDELGECFLIAAQGARLEPLAPPGERGTPVCERPLRNVRQFRHPHRNRWSHLGEVFHRSEMDRLLF